MPRASGALALFDGRADGAPQHRPDLLAIEGEQQVVEHAVPADLALELLRSYDWPGNIRELLNMIESAVSIAEGVEIQARDLPLIVRGQDPPAGLDLSENMSLEELERRYISLLLERLGGHRAKVAKVLRISERNLYRKLRAYNLADASVSSRRRAGAAPSH